MSNRLSGLFGRSMYDEEEPYWPSLDQRVQEIYQPPPTILDRKPVTQVQAPVNVVIDPENVQLPPD